MLTYKTTGPVATITIDDPERRNPLSTEVMARLLDAVREASRDPRIRVVVITGAGDRVFSAGGDLAGGFVDDPIGGHDARGALADVFREIRLSPKPVIARVNGHALAGGFGLAAACDIVIAVDTATFGTPEVGVGLWPMMIGAILGRAMPPRVALEMMLTGRRIDAAEAVRLGLVSRAVPADQLDTAVAAAVEGIVAASPAVIAMGKAAFYAVEGAPFDAALDHLHIGLTAVAMTEDAAEGVAAFMAKRPPQWTGR